MNTNIEFKVYHLLSDSGHLCLQPLVPELLFLLTLINHVPTYFEGLTLGEYIFPVLNLMLEFIKIYVLVFLCS